MIEFEPDSYYLKKGSYYSQIAQRGFVNTLRLIATSIRQRIIFSDFGALQDRPRLLRRLPLPNIQGLRTHFERTGRHLSNWPAQRAEMIERQRQMPPPLAA